MGSCWRRFTTCWTPPRAQYVQVSRTEKIRMDREDDPLIWSRDLEKHYYGELSFAVVQANNVVEDYSQVETGKEVTFAGVYDGHGGTEAARYVCNHLFNHLVRNAREQGTVSEDVIKNAFSETERGFLTVVKRAFDIDPLITGNGSCVVVGMIWKSILYIANLGDSRATLGLLTNTRQIVSEQITEEHNVSHALVRDEMRRLFPNQDIVVMRNGTWRVKGIIQVTRSIGDAYMKRQEFAVGPSISKFHIPEPITQPLLRATPDVYVRHLTPETKFLILASDGLWEHLTNQQVVDIVHNSPRKAIARRLLKYALVEAAKKTGRTYKALKKAGKGERRSIHDDITVIVIFIDHDRPEEGVPCPLLSMKGFKENSPSGVNLALGLEVNPNTGTTIAQSSQSIAQSYQPTAQSYQPTQPIGQSSQSTGQSPEAGPSQPSQSTGKSPEIGPSHPSQSTGKSPEIGPSQPSQSTGKSPEAGPSHPSFI